MLRLVQKMTLGLMSTMLLSSAYALECPSPEDFKDVVQLPPFSFNPQKKQIHFFGVASNYSLEDEHTNMNNDWLMIMDIKTPSEQATDHIAEELISHLGLYSSTPKHFSLKHDMQVSYCLYQSNENPELGAIAYHLPKGYEVKTQAHLTNFVRLISQK